MPIFERVELALFENMRIGAMVGGVISLITVVVIAVLDASRPVFAVTVTITVTMTTITIQMVI